MKINLTDLCQLYKRNVRLLSLVSAIRPSSDPPNYRLTSAIFLLKIARIESTHMWQWHRSDLNIQLMSTLCSPYFRILEISSASVLTLFR